MTPEEFEQEMSIIADIWDNELRHIKADDLMCRLLEDLGYSAGVDVYESMQKWYA